MSVGSCAQGNVRMDRNCIACHASAHTLLYRKENCDIWRCEQCGLGSAVPAAEVDYEAIYGNGYFTGGGDGYADYAATESVVRAEFRKSLAVIKDLHPRARTILEIGSAYGYFLDEARVAGMQCLGIEYSAEAAAWARARGHDVIQGAATQETIEPLGKFDVVVMFDTIEHLPNAAEVIALCAARLNSGGLLMMTTGDFGSAYARASGSKWRLMTPPAHVYYFTRNSMEEMGARHGLRVESYAHPWKIVPVSLILYQLPVLFGFKTKFQGPALASKIGLPVNLFDAMRIVFRKQYLI